MTQIFQIVALAFNLNAAPAAAQYQPCVYPNPCSGKTVEAPAAQIQPCVYPNTCSGKNGEAPAVETLAGNAGNGVTICLYPNPCGANGAAASVELEEVTAQFTTCQYPQPCSGVAGIEEKI